MISPADDGAGVAVCLASGGHPPAMVCRTDGTVVESGARCPLLGVSRSVAFVPEQLQLRPGDLLVLYTDGLVDARGDGELFGPWRLRQAIAEHRSLPAGELAGRLAEAARSFADQLVSDDIAVVVVRVR